MISVSRSMITRNRSRFAFSCLTLTAILLTLCFIFGNSMLPQKESAELSGNVLGFLQRIFGTESSFARFLATYVRKLAHFAEFGFLAFEAFLFTRIQRLPPLTSAILSLPFGLLIAAIDETLQIFTNRGSSVVDVLIDFSGFFTATAITYLALWLYRKKRKESQNASV